MKHNNKGTNPQGQIQRILERADGTYHIKSNSITSLAFCGATAVTNCKDVTVYTKASIYKVSGGVLTSVDGNVTLRLDAQDGCAPTAPCGQNEGDTIGFISTKTSAPYDSNNWVYDTKTLSWRTVPQPVSRPGGTPAVIN